MIDLKKTLYVYEYDFVLQTYEPGKWRFGRHPTKRSLDNTAEAPLLVKIDGEWEEVQPPYCREHDISRILDVLVRSVESRIATFDKKIKKIKVERDKYQQRLSDAKTAAKKSKQKRGNHET
jgi:septal ring factor EnvC (AmiA/AmiB activator)